MPIQVLCQKNAWQLKIQRPFRLGCCFSHGPAVTKREKLSLHLTHAGSNTTNGSHWKYLDAFHSGWEHANACLQMPSLMCTIPNGVCNNTHAHLRNTDVTFRAFCTTCIKGCDDVTTACCDAVQLKWWWKSLSYTTWGHRYAGSRA